jgi:hypothetical protein
MCSAPHGFEKATHGLDLIASNRVWGKMVVSQGLWGPNRIVKECGNIE